ncbi:terminase large subunit domain-containing protein [Pontibacter qinzhouensis]|nr:terminase family protein [Pontibacter qinzhouensis]
MQVLSTKADIAIGGAAAGVGKTFSLLVEPLRHVQNPKFTGVIFRRTSPQIRMSGGLWDASQDLYYHAGGAPRETFLDWAFPSGAKIDFEHLQYESDKLNYQGSEIVFIGFDELTHFSESMFFYMLSRNRSTSGIKPYIRATCNPDPDSWVANFISWWIDQDEILEDGTPNPNFGYPIKERVGKLRYFTRDGNAYVWGDTAQEVKDRCPHIYTAELADTDPKSVTFIPGSIYDNKILLKSDPGYLGNLMTLDEATQAALLRGNWKVKLSGDSLILNDRINDLYTNTHIPLGKKYITVDAARFGSDLAVIKVWDGWRLVDVAWFPISSTAEIAEQVKVFEKRYAVPRSQTVCDADGIGGGVVDQLPGMHSFINNGTPLEVEIGGKKVKPNFFNLKTQCYYYVADKINKAEVYVVPEVAERVISNKGSQKRLREYINEELRAIKKGAQDMDGKKKINSKEEQKNILGRSPDFADNFAMRSYFDLKPVGMKSNFMHLLN